MPTNKSAHKVRVTRLFGAGETSGLMDPQVNMNVMSGIDSRWIVSLDSGNYQVGLALASGGAEVAKQYPEYLTIDQVKASGFGWPTGNGDVTFGHHGIFPNGVPLGIASGEAYQGGDSLVHLFNRVPDFPG